ncbi:hypothetical protein B0H15DRAFT_1024983 [Mycena belliarum]|uniref:Uncharacterized protein n=1 Tax=Mycena belliarum TaxID=1033014 RepID=A0AAD6XKM9_9AGAR|nr:hypothetical protein B0H15DRAFT_1024983 [Mycena belliae]
MSNGGSAEFETLLASSHHHPPAALPAPLRPSVAAPPGLPLIPCANASPHSSSTSTTVPQRRVKAKSAELRSLTFLPSVSQPGAWTLHNDLPRLVTGGDEPSAALRETIYLLYSNCTRVALPYPLSAASASTALVLDEGHQVSAFSSNSRDGFHVPRYKRAPPTVSHPIVPLYRTAVSSSSFPVQLSSLSILSRTRLALPLAPLGGATRLVATRFSYDSPSIPAAGAPASQE